MNEIRTLEHNNVVVATTKQIAEAYKTTTRKISNNFNNNKSRYVEGKHYFFISGDELKDLQSQNLGLQNSKSRTMYLWTERGALLLAKSINTDVAWEAYERLVDFYFDKKEENELANCKPANYIGTTTTLLPENPNWYARHNRKIEYICKKFKTNRRNLYHNIMLKVGEKYDIEAAQKIYEKENGYPPKYAMDIIGYFPQLAAMATEYIDWLVEWHK